MKFLLDTCTFLWLAGGDPELSANAFRVAKDHRNALFLSAASVWEMAIKAKLGKLELPLPVRSYVPDRMHKLGIEGLPITHSHTVEVAELPLHHRDPFDRLLVAQSRAERLTLLSPDPLLQPYGVEIAW